MSKYALPKLSQLRLHFEKGNPYLLALGALALGLSMLVGVSAGGLWIAGKFDRLPEANPGGHFCAERHRLFRGVHRSGDAGRLDSFSGSLACSS